MKRPIIYAYVPIDEAQRTCTVYLLVPPGEFETSRKRDTVQSLTDLKGIGNYGYKTYSGYLIYKAPGVHKYYNPQFPKLQGVIYDKSLKAYTTRWFKRIPLNIPESKEVLYGFTGVGEILIDRATVYALIPKLFWKPPFKPLLQDFPKGLRLFHQQSVPDPEDSQRYYIVKIPGITRCTFLEPYQDGKDALTEFQKTLERI